MVRVTTAGVIWIRGGLGEYLIDRGPGYRLYLAQDGDAVIILFVRGTKKRQPISIGPGRCWQNTKPERRLRSHRAGGDDMELRRDFKETVKERAARDPAFAKAMFDEAATLS
jgi:hypothetical protein